MLGLLPHAVQMSFGVALTCSDLFGHVYLCLCSEGGRLMQAHLRSKDDQAAPACSCASSCPLQPHRRCPAWGEWRAAPWPAPLHTQHFSQIEPHARNEPASMLCIGM